MDRLAKIKELTAKKVELDAELRQLKETLKAEAAAMRLPRKSRAKKEPDLPLPPPVKADGKAEPAKK